MKDLVERVQKPEASPLPYVSQLEPGLQLKHTGSAGFTLFVCWFVCLFVCTLLSEWSDSERERERERESGGRLFVGVSQLRHIDMKDPIWVYRDYEIIWLQCH